MDIFLLIVFFCFECFDSRDCENSKTFWNVSHWIVLFGQIVIFYRCECINIHYERWCKHASIRICSHCIFNKSLNVELNEKCCKKFNKFFNEWYLFYLTTNFRMVLFVESFVWQWRYWCMRSSAKSHSVLNICHAILLLN